MANPVIRYDLEKNSFGVYHNKFPEFKDSNTQEWDDNLYNDEATPTSIAHTKDTKKILGISMKNFLDTESPNYKGLQAEKDFRTLLNKKNIPCLYVGQGINFTERTPELEYCNEKIKIKRPDFLVCFPELGNVLIDVKCRQKWAYGNDNVFYLNYSDIDQLYQLRTYLNLPVWIAFKESDDKDFYISNIKIIYEIKKDLFDNYKGNRITKHLRIPNEILTNIGEQIPFQPTSNFDRAEYVKTLIHLETNTELQHKYLLPDEKN